MSSASTDAPPARHGAVGRLLHWASAALVLALIPLGAVIARMEPSLDRLWLYPLHKTLGISVLALTLARLAWRRYRPPPRPAAAPARWTHRLLLALLVGQPVLGWIGSSATGIDTMVFGAWVLPPLVAPSEALENLAFAVHRGLGWGLAALVALHVAGALHGQFVRRDGTLSRMAGRN